METNNKRIARADLLERAHEGPYPTEDSENTPQLTYMVLGIVLLIISGLGYIFIIFNENIYSVLTFFVITMTTTYFNFKVLAQPVTGSKQDSSSSFMTLVGSLCFLACIYFLMISLSLMFRAIF